MKDRTITALYLALTFGVFVAYSAVIVKAGELREIEGWMLEKMIQEQELNPCRMGVGDPDVIINPVAYYIEIPEGQKERGIVNQISYDVRLRDIPTEALDGAGGTFSASELTEVPGYSGCYRKGFTAPTVLAKDGTKFILRVRLEHSAGPTGPWVEAVRPFSLRAIGTEPILAPIVRLSGTL